MILTFLLSSSAVCVNWIFTSLQKKIPLTKFSPINPTVFECVASPGANAGVCKVIVDFITEKQLNLTLMDHCGYKIVLKPPTRRFFFTHRPLPCTPHTPHTSFLYFLPRGGSVGCRQWCGLVGVASHGLHHKSQPLPVWPSYVRGCTV